MTGFEPQISGIGSDRSANWATSTARGANFSSLNLPRLICAYFEVTIVNWTARIQLHITKEANHTTSWLGSVVALASHIADDLGSIHTNGIFNLGLPVEKCSKY